MLKVKGDLQNPLLTLLLNHCPMFLGISTKQQGERFSLGLKKAAQRTLFWTFQMQCFLGWRLAPEMLRHPGDESVLEPGAAHGSQRPAACPLPDQQTGGREGRQATDSTGLRRCLLLSWTPQHSPMMLGLGGQTEVTCPNTGHAVAGSAPGPAGWGHRGSKHRTQGLCLLSCF